MTREEAIKAAYDAYDTARKAAYAAYDAADDAADAYYAELARIDKEQPA